MEDNSAVVTLANTETSYAKKCKHFLMVLNYIKEQMSLGQIETRKIYGKLNNADLHTKPLRSTAFRTMAHKILGQPPHIEAHLPPTQSPAKNVSHFDMDASCQPLISDRKRAPGQPDESTGAKRRRTHLLRYLTSSTGTDSGGRRTYTGHNRKQKLTAASMHTTLSPIPHCTVTHDVSYTRTAMYKKPLR